MWSCLKPLNLAVLKESLTFNSRFLWYCKGIFSLTVIEKVISKKLIYEIYINEKSFNPKHGEKCPFSLNEYVWLLCEMSLKIYKLFN